LDRHQKLGDPLPACGRKSPSFGPRHRAAALGERLTVEQAEDRPRYLNGVKLGRRRG
jgi:hypothetical protein